MAVSTGYEHMGRSVFVVACPILRFTISKDDEIQKASLLSSFQGTAEIFADLRKGEEKVSLLCVQVDGSAFTPSKTPI